MKRREATKLGLQRYFTGKPCKHGHLSERLTLSGTCVECNAQYYCAWKTRNPERERELHKKWSEKNSMKRTEYRRDWWQKNKGRERTYYRKYYSSNRKGFAIRCSLRRRRFRQATPKWVDIAMLREIYARCPKGLVVDHIVPLRGKTVCGLHVPWNLQYLLPTENSSKGNKLVTDALVSSRHWLDLEARVANLEKK